MSLPTRLQHAARLLVNKTADTLHAATARQAANSGLRDALNVVTQNLRRRRVSAEQSGEAAGFNCRDAAWRGGGMPVRGPKRFSETSAAEKGLQRSAALGQQQAPPSSLDAAPLPSKARRALRWRFAPPFPRPLPPFPRPDMLACVLALR